MKYWFSLLGLSCALCAQQDPYQKIKPLDSAFEVLPVGTVLPQQWLKSQIEENLEGFTGQLDRLAPDLILQDDIYGQNRLSKKVKSKEVGAIGVQGDWQVQFLWWNSETQSNWRDGFIRSAILTGDAKNLAKAKAYVDHILAGQDADGYLGIYDRELRYQFDNENGELWAKATLLRGLLAWYQHTGDQKVLEAVRKAVQNTMDGFPVWSSHPFYSVQENVGGLSHGLTFTDVLEELYGISGDKQYLDYALFLYRDFSTQKLNEDGQYSKLLKADVPLKGHGVHTYEQLRSLTAAYAASGNPALLKAISAFETKIDQTTEPSGGPIGDEWIGGVRADATKRGYEYCSLQEVLHSYASLLAKTGNAAYGDKIEKLFFNAAQGARHPQQSCIAYLKSDNSYEMSGGLNGDRSDPKQSRYRYSPVHKEAAVCCVPNAGRIAPYYTQYMWLKERESLVAALLGPSEVRTRINGRPVLVRAVTSYPFSEVITFEIEAETAFTLKIRRPGWAEKVLLSVPYTEASGYLVVAVKTGKSVVTVTFPRELRFHKDLQGDRYLSFGALVLAHPIAARAEVTKTYALPHFADTNYLPENATVYAFSKSPDCKPVGQNAFEMTAVNTATGSDEIIELVPMGETILRQITFKNP